eukprot:5199853-Lingulodinium_polyedra.AAC.1
MQGEGARDVGVVGVLFLSVAEQCHRIILALLRARLVHEPQCLFQESLPRVQQCPAMAAHLQ